MAESITDGVGKKLKVHDRTLDCDRWGCAIHSPTNHKMREWPLNYRADTGRMERLCEHGVGHPDPDDLRYVKREKGGIESGVAAVHGCDNCCGATSSVDEQTAAAEEATKALPERFYAYSPANRTVVAVIDLAAVTRIEWRRLGDFCAWELTSDGSEATIRVPGDPELPARWARARARGRVDYVPEVTAHIQAGRELAKEMLRAALHDNPFERKE